ncbi:hypothetical protein AGLY_014462 [Aphis glycines]|uniref:Transmembrane protein n=1 Tax=Aphis glycines TaxID=307491 RepID=A0A6G0T3Q7_APHGL|nr:hypothetical protein AGLY_014462 [Aphis glycines]
MHYRDQKKEFSNSFQNNWEGGIVIQIRITSFLYTVKFLKYSSYRQLKFSNILNIKKFWGPKKNRKINTNYLISFIAIYRYLKYTFLFSFFTKNIDNFFLAKSKYLKIECKDLYDYCHLKIIRIHWHNFFLIAFEVQILTKFIFHKFGLQLVTIILKELKFWCIQFRPLKHKPSISPTTGNYIL